MKNKFIDELINNYIGGNLRNVLMETTKNKFEKFLLSEIRIRGNKPLLIKTSTSQYFISKTGERLNDPKLAYTVTIEDVKKTLELISNYSLYAFEEEISKGFLTLPAGHRVGICGQTVIENGKVKTIKNINGFNIRISHEILGCGEKIINHVTKPTLKNTIIISPPGCGKTTLLRDLARILSNDYGYNIGIADERSEIAGCYMGIPQNDVGYKTDVLDCCPKAIGMSMLLRSMSPEIIVVDEIGKKDDVDAIEEIINSGVKIICTAHGENIEDIKNKPALSALLNMNVIENFIVLKNGDSVGELAGIYDKNMKAVTVE